MKLLLEELCAAAGVKVQLHTRVAAAHREGRALRTILTESKSGRQAPVFIDATGDGDLGALAGCEFEIGRDHSCPCQPMTMYALLVVKDVALLADMLYPAGTYRRYDRNEVFREVLSRAGGGASHRAGTAEARRPVGRRADCRHACVTGNAVAMGEAAGVTAALAASSKAAPHDVSWREVRPMIAKVRE